MQYEIEYDPQARRDLDFWKKNSTKTYNEILDLIEEIAEHPRTGSGRPNALRNIKYGWSRRINGKDRIKYQIFDKRVYVYVISARGHYDDH